MSRSPRPLAGATALKSEPEGLAWEPGPLEAAPVRRRAARPQRRPWLRRGRSADLPRFLLRLACALALGLWVAARYAALAEQGYELVAIKQELQVLRMHQQQLEARILALRSLGRVESAAIERLGMRPPAERGLVVEVASRQPEVPRLPPEREARIPLPAPAESDLAWGEGAMALGRWAGEVAGGLLDWLDGPEAKAAPRR